MIASRARPTSQTPTTSSLRSGRLTPRGSDRSANGNVDQADRHVDEEDQAPARCLPEVGADERTGEDRRSEHGEARCRAEQPGGLAELLVVEDLLQHAEPLRDHQCAEAALQRSEGDEHAHVLAEGAGSREQGESRQAEQEHAAAAEDVTEPGACDQQHGEGQRVGGAQPLDGALSATEVQADGRPRDVDDGGVEQVHGVGSEHDERDDPADAAVAGRRVRGRRCWLGPSEMSSWIG